MEGLYHTKEKETFKEGEHSVSKGGLSKAMRKLVGRGVNWEDQCEEE